MSMRRGLLSIRQRAKDGSIRSNVQTSTVYIHSQRDAITMTSDARSAALAAFLAGLVPYKTSLENQIRTKARPNPRLVIRGVKSSFRTAKGPGTLPPGKPPVAAVTVCTRTLQALKGENPAALSKLRVLCGGNE